MSIVWRTLPRLLERVRMLYWKIQYLWIGVNALIGPGITIGDNAVVGAPSVVTRNVPAGEIWAGVPARMLRKKA